ncbi:probable protein phosphatase 2C 38 isoform X2 [Cynara cardunculus var. scolymus]|uniref:probable protein phosphatase 2C 38 isoform X2 n=1 Tax=Cynara cardunculus var. scolymus TaxID=59895 RepID=UPI000D62736D|nr:probable protein phosphatase 2C 38 isoform X2 [Cynara cardunculus var. scolymus]
MVRTTLKKIVYPCWKPSFLEGDSQNGGREADSGGIVDGLWWYKDSGKHVYGDFSMAMIQANKVLEDQCQLESGCLSSVECGPRGTFVGIYDGHAGPEASRFINDRLFDNMKKYASESEGMSDDIVHKAFLATEEEFLSLVESKWLRSPGVASVGSCCLVGIICNGVLYIANAGDSRAVLAREERTSNTFKAVRVSEEHNANMESVREELRSLHPNDPNIVVLKHNVWRVRGLIQVSRSIGDAYLKKPEFNRDPLLPKFRLSESFSQPILKAEPSILVQKLTPKDQFLIFASDGLWEHLSDQEAVDIVKSSPRHGIARKLVKAALIEAAKKREMRYSDLKKVDGGVRRHFHDDITVIVLFLNCHLPTKSSSSGAMISVKGGIMHL